MNRPFYSPAPPLPVRTRFAPSPTGTLHIGSARTALYNWLFARHSTGKFILRIEDTDRARSTPESVTAIFRAMHWLQLDYDEGPFFQTERFERYREVIQQWLNAGLAYCCTCSKERLDALRTAQLQQQQKPRYDGHCRDKQHVPNPNAPYVVRFRMPQEGQIQFVDAVHGPVVFQNNELDDLIIQRSDGTPTYNFTVSVDDADMRISHVIRGDDHLSNTPKQYHMLLGLGAPLPQYVHVPMILGPDGKKLSKRHGAVDVHTYAENGFLPEALINTLVRLGWSHGNQEIFSITELIDAFDLSHLSPSAAALNPEKALWLNQQHLKSASFEAIFPHLEKLLNAQHRAHWITAEPSLEAVFSLQSGRVKTLQEWITQSAFFYEVCDNFPTEHSRPEYAATWSALRTALAELPTWNAQSIQELLRALAAQLHCKLGNVAQPLRIALTHSTVSPSIDHTAALLGREKTLQRLDQALQTHAAHF